MESGDFHREFHAACFLGDMPKIHEAIATALTVEELNAGLKSATRGCHIDAVAALFNAGAHISAESTGALRGEYGNQDPRVVRLFLDKGLDPNATNSKGEPILPYDANGTKRQDILTNSGIAHFPTPKLQQNCSPPVQTPTVLDQEESHPSATAS